MSGAQMQAYITGRLAEVAAGQGVRILLAVESGSRAWGFASPDSDWDVRFIYAHPQAWYLTLIEGRDVIEKGIDERLVDLNGWDVRKALRLLLKSNPVLYEWLVSPIVYLDDGAFQQEARALFEAVAEPRALAAHYWSIAQGQWKREIEGETQVRLKKYFYVVRPLLSLQWVVREQAPPPMQIEELLEGSAVPPAVEAELGRLVALKRGTPELGRGSRIAAIDEWAQAELARLAPDRLSLERKRVGQTSDAADRLFRSTIGFAPRPG